MIELRPFASLGGANLGWLDVKHHFTFAEYHNPERMHWGALRVWNDATLQPGMGIPPHTHTDMEIITYVCEGAITQHDNLGNKGRTIAGEVQVMSAGAGIRHTEHNREPGIARLFHIWISPDRRGEPPSWGSKPFPKEDRSGRFVVLASGIEGDEDALPIRSDTRVLGATLKAGETAEYRFSGEDRHGYLVPATGQVDTNGIVVHARDGAAISNETLIRVTAVLDSEVVLVDAAG